MSYYDDKARVVQRRASTHLGGVEKDWFLYDYTGNLVLEDGARTRLLFDGGYMSLSDNAYHYFLTDHLGSVRVVASSADAAEEHVFITFNKQTNNAGT